MLKLFIIIVGICCLSFIDWHYSLDEAKQLAKKEHRHILLNFSGSDWCGPCIRMHREIFESETFKKVSDSDLVMLNADFPRMKKNQLSPKQQEMNNALADKYNSKGSFPLTVLLDADGKVLKEWDGFPKTKTEIFIEELRTAINKDKSGK
jgi:thioredoxin-related protein